jgi:glycosyltransferase involved in cell wall biosynthesis
VNACRVLVRGDGHSVPRPLRRVVHCTGSLPFPPYGGGELREWEWLRRMSQDFEVHLVAMTNAFDRDVGYADDVLRHARTLVLAETSAGPGEPPPAAVPSRLWHYRSSALRDQVGHLVASVAPHLLHVEGCWMLAHLTSALPAPLLLVADNVEHRLERQEAAARGLPPDAVDRGSRRMRAWEVRAWRRAALVGAVSEQDGEQMRRLVPRLQVRWLPPGSDHLRDAAVRRHAGGRPPTLGYVANFGWRPSSDAAEFLVSEVWPLVKRAVPTACLVLAGSGVGPELRGAAERAEDVSLTGPVPSLAGFMARTDVVIAPLRFGGGVKMKMLEGLCAGCAIVTTPVGLQGLPDDVRTAVVVAEGAQSLAAEAAALLASPDRQRALSDRARRACALLPTWDESERRLRSAWLEAALPGP